MADIHHHHHHHHHHPSGGLRPHKVAGVVVGITLLLYLILMIGEAVELYSL